MSKMIPHQSFSGEKKIFVIIGAYKNQSLKHLNFKQNAGSKQAN